MALGYTAGDGRKERQKCAVEFVLNKSNWHRFPKEKAQLFNLCWKLFRSGFRPMEQ